MIGSYVLQRHLGEGSYGEVKLAKHRATGQKVAIKISTEEETTREFNILKTLSHVNIVQPLDVVRIPSELRTKPTHDRGMVMEFIDGGDLIQLIERYGKLTEMQAIQHLYHIVSALHHCHSRGIAHRDVKPDNLLVDSKTGNMILADFGLATSYHPNQLLRGKVGSVLYAAPEVLLGAPYVGPEIDIWSAGVVFYCMLSGCIPWEGHALEEQLQRAVTGNYYRLPNVSRDTDKLLAAMLSVDPRVRPTAEDVLRRLCVVLCMQQPLSPSSSVEEEEGECSDISPCGSIGSNDMDAQPTRTRSPFSPTPSTHDDLRTITAKELKTNDYHLVYLDMEVLSRALELAFSSLHITSKRISKKKSWINGPALKFQCKYSNLKWELEVCKTRDDGSNTKILLCSHSKGDAGTVKTLCAQLYNKLPLM